MNDRELLLAAIKQHSLENTPRLIYADWLDEHGESDLDRATSEFIRVSCPDRTNPRMPKAAFDWIGENWHRLLPSLLEKRTPKRMSFMRSGRFVNFQFQLDKKHLGILDGDEVASPWLLRWKPCEVSCHRGFVEQVMWWSRIGQYMAEIVKKDQPFAFTGNWQALR